MDTRRDFLKKAILLSAAEGMTSMLPASIQRAAAIDPEVGSTYLDAEHVVILMQENRSFDHCFGTLRGVRGFNDPRAITLPNKNKVWMQTNDGGETYIPFRFDMHNTKATWMGAVPHSRSSQVDAYNYGKYDKWLQSKRVRNKKYADMPLTLGHYTREDIPFTYALADAFTVCDQHFCSVMSSTDPNRLYFWTGSIKIDEGQGRYRQRIRNNFPGLGKLNWDTFPERLQDNGISWKMYQNDIMAGGGFKGEERTWLANFGCNPLEWFANYNVKFSSRYIQGLQQQVVELPNEIKALEDKIKSLPNNDTSLEKLKSALAKKKEVLKDAQKDLEDWSQENYNKLSEKEKELYQRAFTINKGDPYYHDLTPLSYTAENGEERSLKVPKGDVLHQFREDVEMGKLPTVSWLVPPGNLIDHPSSPWYGSFYVSEILDILTKNPEIWKKTIFILTFDENDGYFDHVPPFVAPNPLNPETGKCSPGLDIALEYIHREDELKEGIPSSDAREGSIGLGFRVPLIVASPWSRGGNVCSQVFDHTSTLQFLEGFFNKKYGKNIKENNITDWRRAVAGDLTAVFDLHNGSDKGKLPFINKDPFYKKIYDAKFKEVPSGFKPLSQKEIEQINRDPSSSPIMPKQEKGIRPSCPLPYELYVDGKLSDSKKEFQLRMAAGNEVFGKKSSGSPFNVYLPGKYAEKPGVFKNVGSRSYTVTAGDNLSDFFPVHSFDKDIYHLCVYGPNGFFREFTGNIDDPEIEIVCDYERSKGFKKKFTGNIALKLINLSPSHSFTLEIRDNAYKNKSITKILNPIQKQGKQEHKIVLNIAKSHCWYDFTVRILGFDHFEKRYAGHVETGNYSFTDPAMGRVIL